MSQETKPAEEYYRPNSVLAGFLSYLIPGLGQISQGRVGKGLLFMVTLLGLFHVGQAMGRWQNVYLPHDDNAIGPRNMNPIRNIFNYRWHYAGQFWIGVAAWPAIWQYYGGPPAPPENGKSFIYNYQRQPANENELNNFLVNSDKTPDLGWIYTVIAGMLNILVIYDAFAGPAYGKGFAREDATKAPSPEGVAS